MIDCYSRKQATVESATFGAAEFIAGRTAIQQTRDIRTSLRYLGVPITEPTYMFSDNKSMITNGSVPHSKLRKRHLALAYHEVRQAVASGMVILTHVEGELNVADIPSKHWLYQKIWPLLRPLLFWHGDTQDIPKQEKPDWHTAIKERGVARSFFSGMVQSLTQVGRRHHPVEPCMKMTAQKDGVYNEHCVLRRYTYLHVEIIGYKEREMCISLPRILTII